MERHLFMHIIAEPLTTTLSTNLALLFSQILLFYFTMITRNFRQEPVVLSPRMYMWIFSIIWYLPGQHNPASTAGSWWVLLLLHLKDYLYSFQNNYYCVLIMWKITKGVLCPNWMTLVENFPNHFSKKIFRDISKSTSYDWVFVILLLCGYHNIPVMFCVIFV